MHELFSHLSVQPGGSARAGQSAGLDSAVTSVALLERMLDIVDYGMLLVLPDGRVAFANQVARIELDERHPLQLAGQSLRVRHACHVGPLREALSCALLKGLQRMLTLSEGSTPPVNLAVVPVSGPGSSHCAGAMVLLGKREVCDDLSAEAFARHHHLTAAEVRVLKQLCTGHRPAEIARSQGVTLSTVRTQIYCVREKTGAASIGALVRDVARLPPLVSLLRAAA